MTDTLRAQVAAQARRGGYGAADLEQIATAAWPDFTPGNRLDDNRLHAMADVILPLCIDGLVRPGTLGPLLEAYRTEHPADWRAQFWRVRQQIADRRRNATALPPLFDHDEHDLAAEGLAALQALTGRSEHDLLADPAITATAPERGGVPHAA